MMFAHAFFSLMLSLIWGTPNSQRIGLPEPTPAAVTGVRPDVVVRGTKGVTLMLHGVNLRKLKTISVVLCSGDAMQLPVIPKSNIRATVSLPDTATAEVCIIRIGERVDDTLPVAVGDESLATWGRPQGADSAQWYGLFLGDQTSSEATLMGFELENAVWVLGKNKSAVMKIKADKIEKDKDGSFMVKVHLPGVQEKDVQWEDQEDSHFWLARVSPDGTALIDYQPLSSMIREPGKPISR